MVVWRGEGEKLPFLLLTNDLFDFISGMEVRYYNKAKENGLSNPKVSILTLALSAWLESWPFFLDRTNRETKLGI